MNNGLLLILIIIGNLCLYWVLFGQKKFRQKLQNHFDNPSEFIAAATSNQSYSNQSQKTPQLPKEAQLRWEKEN